MKKIIIIILLLIIGAYIYTNYVDENIFEAFKYEIEGTSKLSDYSIYGNHLNIKGYFQNEIDSNYESISLVLKDEEKELEYDINYDSDKLYYYLSDKINEGINLEEIELGDYYFLIKVDYKVEEEIISKYYALENDTNYDEIDYYKISTNNKTDNIKSSTKSIEGFNSWWLEINNIDKPSDIYDIVIDPGHGGADSGAVNGEYHESFYTLRYSLALKEKLELEGYKVYITRDDDTWPDTYGLYGRATVANTYKAKLLLSIHFNATEEHLRYGGLEIYSPYNADYTFARAMIENIREEVGINYSNRKENKLEDGLYVRTFTLDDISDSEKTANKNGYEPYNITEETNYYYMIRESGGLNTGAMTDGRNKKYDSNPYYLSNMTTEAYLLELAYLNLNSDLELIKYSKDKYVDAIVKSINENYNK